jgi:hypothetical protein
MITGKTKPRERAGKGPNRIKKKLQLQKMRKTKQVLRKAAKIGHAIAVERKDIQVLTAQRRTQERKKIGQFGKPSNICRLKGMWEYPLLANDGYD